MKKRAAFLMSLGLCMAMLAGCGRSDASINEKEAQQEMAFEDDSQGENASDDTKNAGENANAGHAVIVYKDKEESESQTQTELTEIPFEEPLYVEKVENLPDDFLHGVDVSSLLAEEESGVVFYKENGEEADALEILASYGVNAVRIRVWNDPWDENGNSYGGGHNDLDTAIAIGKRATQNHMKTMIDFHYSDFWADPNKQMVPKAWDGMKLEKKGEALYEYTKESLEKLITAGIDVNAVQIGNEITTGMSGVKSMNDRITLIQKGIQAVCEVEETHNISIKKVIHFTNPEKKGSYREYAQALCDAGVMYDVFGSSYYPYWHGSLDNLTATLKEVAETFDKDVMVVEVSYPYTNKDGDGSGNSVSAEAAAKFPYPISIQGQSAAIRDVTDAVVKTGRGIGVYYWEPAWIPVPGNSKEERSVLWEKYGSGWASSFAGSYDPKDAGQYYGGSSWDNQALFDFAGNPLPSLQTYRLMKEGSGTERPESLNTAAEEQLKDVEGNLVRNYSFEDSDTSMWTIEKLNNTTKEAYILDKETDAVTGTYSMHFWSDKEVEFKVEQTMEIAETGTYSLEATLHGGDAKEQNIYLYAITANEEYKEETDVDGWMNFRTPKIDTIKLEEGEKITVGVYVSCSAGAWGNIDDVVLKKIE